MGIFAAPRCPVDAREQNWIEASMAWFRSEFREGPLREPVVLPTTDFFPGLRVGEANNIDLVVAQTCQYASVDPGGLTVEVFGDAGSEELSRATGLTFSSSGAAGHYRLDDYGRVVLGIDRTLASSPIRLIATIAHELGHVRLNETRDRTLLPDHEPLTDLLTVYLGFGIFTANARFQFSQRGGQRSISNLGYLTEPMFGYGLACFAWQRGEPRPEWAKHLDPNPKAALKRGLRYLAAQAQPGEFPTLSSSR